MDKNTNDRTCEVVVIGGGGAGLAGALQLGRSRWSVVVVDAGEPRNAPAAHMHGYLGREGEAPADFLAIGRREVAGYGVQLVDGRVTEVTRVDERHLQARLADGSTVTARRVLLATGLVDLLPDVPGLAAQWGRNVIHCPFCHGWEVRDQALVVLVTGPMGWHQVGLFRQLSDRVTAVVHAGVPPTDEVRAQMAARGVTVVEKAAAEVVSDGDAVTGVRLADGSVIDATAVVVGPRFEVRADLVAGLGLTPLPHPSGLGDSIEVDPTGATGVAGIWAAGNVANPMGQVLHAAAAGNMAGAALNGDLVTEDTALAVAAAVAPTGSGAPPSGHHHGAGKPVRPDDRAAEWDERYAGDEGQPVWSGRPNGALVAEIEGRTPGRVLDVGAGEGGDAVWLARQGWEVTALEISQVAVDRGRAATREVGVDVTWVRADLMVDPPERGAYDLVSVQYPALPKQPAGVAIAAVLGAVAPRGTLLAVGHDVRDPTHFLAHGFDPADYVQPADLAAALDDSWEIVADEIRPRAQLPQSDDAAPPGTGHTHDVILEARRRT